MVDIMVGMFIGGFLGFGVSLAVLAFLTGAKGKRTIQNVDNHMPQLKAIYEHCESMVDEKDPTCEWKKDTVALQALFDYVEETRYVVE